MSDDNRYAPLPKELHTHDAGVTPQPVVTEGNAGNYSPLQINQVQAGGQDPEIRHPSAYSPNDYGLVGAGLGLTGAEAINTAKLAGEKLGIIPQSLQRYADTQIGHKFNLPLEALKKEAGVPYDLETYPLIQRAIKKVSGSEAVPDAYKKVFTIGPNGKPVFSHMEITPGTPEVLPVDLSKYKRTPMQLAKHFGELPVRAGVAGYDIGRGLSDPASVGGALDIGAGISAAAAPLLKGKVRTAANIAGALPIVGGLIPGASAAPMRPEQVAGTAVDLATGWMSPSELGEGTIRPRDEAYYPGMTGILKGTTLPPGHAEGGDVGKSPASIAGTLQSVGTVQGPSLASKWSEHLASLPQTTEDNLRRQQDIMNRAITLDPRTGQISAGDPQAMNEITNMVSGLGGITSAAKAPITRAIQKFDPRFDPRILEQEKLKNLTTSVEQYQNPNIPKVSLADYEGHPFITSMSDRTAAGGNLVGINNTSLNRPVELMGGQDYMFNNPGQVWASGQSPVKQLSNQAQMMRAQTGKDPLYIPWRMAPTGGDFAHMTGETMLAHADTVLDKTSKKELDTAIKNIIPDWKGISHPDSMGQFRNAPSVARKNVQNMIDKDFRDRGALGIGEARLAVADPNQLNAPEGGIQNIGRIFAGKPIIEKSGHTSYPHGIPGEGIGVIDTPHNIFELLPRAVEQRGITNPKTPSQQDIRALQMKPYSNIIDAKLLKQLGYKEGGSVNSEMLKLKQLRKVKKK